MAVAVHISPEHMSRADYEKVIKELQDKGLDKPGGRRFHAAYGDDEVQVFEVWDSPEQFEDHREQLFATLLGAGINVDNVDVHAVHSELPD